MNAHILVRLAAAIVCGPFVAAASSQEVPSEPVPAASPAPADAPDAAPAGVPDTPPAATPEAAPPPAPPAATSDGKRRIVMLPFEFIVYQKGVGGMEAVPDWTEAASFALGDAAMHVLQDAQRFEVVPLPQLDAATDALVREHVALFRTVGASGITMANAGPAWQGKKDHFDYSVGNGLQFLADSVPAEFALVLVGSSVRQSGGAVFSQFLQGAMGIYSGGGGTFVMTGIFDLRTGELKWVNYESGQQTLGMGGYDVREPQVAQRVVTKLFEIFPASTIAKFPPF